MNFNLNWKNYSCFDSLDRLIHKNLVSLSNTICDIKMSNLWSFKNAERLNKTNKIKKKYRYRCINTVLTVYISTLRFLRSKTNFSVCNLFVFVKLIFTKIRCIKTDKTFTVNFLLIS